MQVNVNLAGLPALVLPCGFVEGGSAGLPVGLQMIGAAFDEVFHFIDNYQTAQTFRELCRLLMHYRFRREKKKTHTYTQTRPGLRLWINHSKSYRLCWSYSQGKLLKVGHIFEQTLRDHSFVPPLVANDFVSSWNGRSFFRRWRAHIQIFFLEELLVLW